MKKLHSKHGNLTYFIGIDVSRNKLDIAVRNLSKILFHREIPNENLSITKIIADLKQLEKFRLSKAVFCMEDSGYYVNHLINVLYKHKANIHLGNPMHIKNSLGLLRDKSDRLDSIRIAHYAYRHRDEIKFWEPQRKEIIHLKTLTSVRNRIITTLGIIKVPLKEQNSFIDQKMHKHVVECCKSSIIALTDDLNNLERSMLAVIRSDERLSRIFDIICSVPYVGPVTAIQIIICTNEFLNITCPRKFACYAGIAPFKQESGVSSGKTRGRISKIGNRKMKKLLHICAVGGIRRNGEFKEYYDRKSEEGKPQLTIINAIRNKLIRRIFSCVKHDRNYLPVEELQKWQVTMIGTAGNSIPVVTGKVKRTKFAKRLVGNL